MQRFKHIFLDDGGVMNDNSLRAPQWQALVGEFFVPRLGGSHEAWAEANRAVFGEVFAWLEAQLELDSSEGWSYESVNREYELRWLRGMMTHAAINSTLTDDQCAALAHEAQDYISRRVTSAFPGAADTLRSLSSEYELFTASMGPSFWLEGSLEAMGVTDLFTRLYGPDLINATKQGVTFYPRMFEHAGVEPGNAIVLDDTPAFLPKIKSAGATPVLVGNRDAGPANQDVLQIAALSELPELLARLDP